MCTYKYIYKYTWRASSISVCCACCCRCNSLFSTSRSSPNMAIDLCWLICVIRLIHMCGMTYSYVCHWPVFHKYHDSSMRVTWLIHACDVIRYSCARHAHRATWPLSRVSRLPRLIQMCDMTHSYVWYSASRSSCNMAIDLRTSAMTHPCV